MSDIIKRSSSEEIRRDFYLKMKQVIDPEIKKNLSTDELFNLIEQLTDGKTLDSENIMQNSPYWNFAYREAFTKLFGWSVPSRTALKQIKEFVGSDLVLEIAAGRGLWSALMRSVNMNVITTSIVDDIYYDEDDMQKIWSDIELLDCTEAVTKYSDANCLFISWGNGQLDKCLQGFKGNKIIVIGERGGCTDWFEDYEKYGFKLHSCVFIPRWTGIRDVVELYTRKIE